MTDTPQAKEAVEALAAEVYAACETYAEHTPVGISHYLSQRIARAILAADYAPRSVTIEECAKVADEIAEHNSRCAEDAWAKRNEFQANADEAAESTANAIAAAIRSLADRKTT